MLLRRLLITAAFLLGSALPGLAAHQMGNGVCETTATSGTGTVSLAGTYAPYSTFVSQITSGNTVTYRITTGSGASLKVETGTGTFTDGAPDTLTRDAEWTTDDQSAPITELTLSGTSTVCLGTAKSTYDGDKGDITFAAGFTSATVDADSVALTTDTTGNYAAGDAEAGAALTGDSATSFFSAGTLEDARIDGSAEADEVLNSDKGDFTCTTGSCTVDANSIALTTDTTGNYAAGDAEGGAATTGDSATAFFSVGTIEDARIDGSAEADEVNPTLGTQTQGNYLDNVTGSATTGVAVTHTPAEGSEPAVAFDFTDKGADPALSADTCVFSGDATSNGEIVCEGDTANTIETRIIVTDPTSSDKTFTIPDATSYAFSDGDKGDITFGSSGGSATVDADSVALTTDTTGNYAAGSAEAGDALSGDSATSFWATGTCEVARGCTGQSTEAEALGEMTQALTQDTAPDSDTDYVATYDASADTGKKVTLEDLTEPNVQEFSGSGTWNKPTNKPSSAMVLIQCVGAGGSGGRAGEDDGGGGGGGGAFAYRWLQLSAMGDTETVTIGAGGTAKTADDTDGAAGGNTTVGSLITCYGGGGGEGITTQGGGGGGGGGWMSAGTNGGATDDDGGNGGDPIMDNGIYADYTDTYIPDLNRCGIGGIGEWQEQVSGHEGCGGMGGSGGGGGNANGGTGGPAGAAAYAGGGGGGGACFTTNSEASGGTSVWGGAGGGGGCDQSQCTTTGEQADAGVSLYGGNGGTGNYSAQSVAGSGSQPGGGGGGSANGNSGAGGAGYARVYVF
jgi:hypothetical protein